MQSKNNAWTKQELHTYILLLCANADSVEGEEELALIKRKVDQSTFEKIYLEFSSDSEDTRFEKISKNINLFHYSNLELIALRKEMETIYFADEKYDMMERNLDRILDNIIY